MRRRREQIIIEVRGPWIVAFQAPNRVAVLAAGATGAADRAGRQPEAGHDLPTPDEVAAALQQAGMTGRSCVLVLPRSDWLLGMGLRAFRNLNELRSATLLEVEATTQALAELTLSAVSVSHAGRGAVGGYVCWAAVRYSTVDRYREWLAQCDLELVEVRAAPFEAVRSWKEPGVLLAWYPTGDWDLHWFADGRLQATYSGTARLHEPSPSVTADVRLFHEELSRVFALMALRHLAALDVDTLPDVQGEIPLRASELQIHLVTSGLPSAAPGGSKEPKLSQALDRFRQVMAQAGVVADVQTEELAGRELKSALWPSFSLMGPAGVALAPRRRLLQQRRTRFGLIRKAPPRRAFFYPIIDVGGPRAGHVSPAWKRPRVQTVAVLSLVILLTFVLGVSHRRVNEELRALQSGLADVSLGARELEQVRQEAARLDGRVRAAERFMEDQSHVVRSLWAIHSALPRDSRVDQLMIDGNGVNLIVSAPSATEVLAQIERSPQFTDVSIRTAISTENQQGRRVERVGVEMRVGSGGVASE